MRMNKFQVGDRVKVREGVFGEGKIGLVVFVADYDGYNVEFPDSPYPLGYDEHELEAADD
jgi:hypothetical protein